ncbi:zinc ribbon domain-containing protein [Bifidobacterium sp. SO4]|uniref:zinc ribbon domain-containing protein n=1 Tax=Bifidobacterium sp. SO4 TaxID=2809030 RepID=UPI001BDD2A90|nr:zinc ribbon domain-containing protein [Bifidobacterium sp. SO4]MBT1170347.1 zinc ribbon domain-containing protein [Bifidobacterium sp. SO4]
MNCLHCGNPLQPGDTFCQACGALQDDNGTLTDRTLRDNIPSDGIPTSPIPVSPVPLPPAVPAHTSAAAPQQGYQFQAGAGNASRASAAATTPSPATGSPATGKTVKSQIVIVVLIAAIVAVVLCIVGIVAYGTGRLGQSGDTTTSASTGNGNSGAASSGDDAKQSGKSKSKTKSDAKDSTDTKKKSGTDSDSQSETKDSKDKKAMDAGTATYSNGRFAYAVDVPASYDRGPESDNGDGVKFSDPDSGVQIAVWGQYNALFHSPQDELDFLKENAGADPAFELVAGQSVYLSYEKDDTIYYIREIVTDEKIAAVKISYPNTDRAAGDPLTETVPPTLHFLQ